MICIEIWKRCQLFIILLLLSPLLLPAQSVMWPRHKKAVIVLTYDDALPSQLKTAVPQLKHAGFKATFFLTSDIDSVTIPQWRKLAKKGFELANHTVFHPCSARPDNPVPSESYTTYQMMREIEVMDRFLFSVDGKTHRTFAYPCTETFVGGQDYVQSLRKYPWIKYARVGGDENSIITDFMTLDPLRIPSYGLQGGETGGQLVAFVKKVQSQGGLGVIMFHGVGGDYLTVSSEAHRQLLNYLHSHRKDIWVTTFQQALDVAFKRDKPVVTTWPVTARVNK